MQENHSLMRNSESGFSPLIPNQDYDQSSPEIVQLMKDTAKAKDDAEKETVTLCRYYQGKETV